jgi:hypothetical protein
MACQCMIVTFPELSMIPEFLFRIWKCLHQGALDSQLPQKDSNNACRFLRATRSAACTSLTVRVQMELRLTIATIVSRLTVRVDAERTSLQSTADLIQQSVSELSLHQAHPVWLRMAPRVASCGA